LFIIISQKKFNCVTSRQSLVGYLNSISSDHRLIEYCSDNLAIATAEKHVLMASLCYNLKKLLKFKPRNVETVAIKVQTKIENLAGKFSNLFFACFDSFSAGINLCFSVLKNLQRKPPSLKRADSKSDFTFFSKI